MKANSITADRKRQYLDPCDQLKVAEKTVLGLALTTVHYWDRLVCLKTKSVGGLSAPHPESVPL